MIFPIGSCPDRIVRARVSLIMMTASLDGVSSGVWVSLCVLFIIGTFGIGILIAWLPLLIVSVWFVYRIVRGWIALREGRGMCA